MDTPVEFFYHSALRWSFGFENPNKAAVLFACLIPLCWVSWLLAWRLRQVWWRRTVLVASAALLLSFAFCLLKTYSRGGLFAAAVGLLYLAFHDWSATRKTGMAQPRLRRIGGIGLYVVLVVMVIVSGVWKRSLETVTEKDRSVENRLVLWRYGLQMAVENPNGFGAGQSGEAYKQWYQPLNMKEGYRTLVNSYLTFLVERGWCVFAVLFVGVAFFWAWSFPKTLGSAVPYRLETTTKDKLFEQEATERGKPLFSLLPPVQIRLGCGLSPALGFYVIVGLRASLLAFGISGLFSTIMEEPCLWIVPGICAVSLMSWSLFTHVRLTQRRILCVSFVATGLLLGLWAVGYFLAAQDSLRRRFFSQQDRLAQTCLIQPRHARGKMTEWLVVPDERIMGSHYGRLLRQMALDDAVTVRVESSVPANDGEIENALIVGAHAGQQVGRARTRLVLLAPEIMKPEDAVALLKSPAQVLILLPEIDEDGRAEFWESIVKESKLPQQVRIVRLPGVGLRVDWAWKNVITCLGGGSR